MQTRSPPARRALVVEDEEAMLEVFTETLQRLGVEVVGEIDSRKAAQHMRDGDLYDVVVLDLRMPYVDGFSLIEQIRAKQPDVPVIVVTGYPSAESAKRCRDLGVLMYLRKPFDPEELNRQVRRALCPRPGGARANLDA